MRKRHAALGVLGVLSATALSGFSAVHSRRTRNVARLVSRFTYWLGKVDGEMAGRLAVGADKAVPAEKLLGLVRFTRGVVLNEGKQGTTGYVWLEASFFTRDNNPGSADVHVKGDPLTLLTLYGHLKSMPDARLSGLMMDENKRTWLGFFVKCPSVNAMAVGRRISEEQARTKATQDDCSQ